MIDSKAGVLQERPLCIFYGTLEAGGGKQDLTDDCPFMVLGVWDHSNSIIIYLRSSGLAGRYPTASIGSDTGW
jgi:hypothetical protein